MNFLRIVIMNLDIKLMLLIATLFIFSSCNEYLYYPAELRLRADEAKLRRIWNNGDCMISKSDEFMMLDGLTFIGQKHINKSRHSFKPVIPQFRNRLDSMRSSKYDFYMQGYTIMGNDTLEDKSNFCGRLQTTLLGVWIKNAGNGYIAANCLATRYIYDYSLLPRKIVYRIDGEEPDERQMRRYVTLSKSELISVSLKWQPADSTLYINIKTRL